MRIHADAQAAESARAVNGAAYTVGHHIAFGTGRYKPATTIGIRLLAYELTHVLQQDRAHNEAKRLPLKKPVGKYNAYNQIIRSSGTSH